jgi:hypothetical protein
MLAACRGEVEIGSPTNDMRIPEGVTIFDPEIGADAIQFGWKWL